MYYIYYNHVLIVDTAYRSGDVDIHFDYATSETFEGNFSTKMNNTWSIK